MLRNNGVPKRLFAQRVLREADWIWCPGPESNRYVPFGTRDFKSRASASFATRAGFAFKSLLYTLSACRFDCGEICGECGPIFGKFLAGAILRQDGILHDLMAGLHRAFAYR